MTTESKNSISRKRGPEIMRFLKNSRGQAVLEYVLLTIMIFIVLLALIVGIARSTQKFAQNYFGDYFECLLELGELPSLGSDNSPDTECDDLYEPFTVTDGRALKDFGNGSNGANGSNGNDDDGKGDSQSDDKNAKDDDSKNKNSNSNSTETATSGSSEGGGNIAGSGGLGWGAQGRMKKVSLSAADKKGAGDDVDALAGAPSGTNNFQQSDSSQSGSGRTRYVPIYGIRNDEDEKSKKTEYVKADVPKNPDEVLRGKRVPVSITKATVDQNTDNDDMSFPDIIKILIITAIILIIAVFFGGQVMQYNKSKD